MLELTQGLALGDWTVRERGNRLRQTTSYWPLIELLKTYFRIEPLDDGPTIRQKVTRSSSGRDQGLLPALPPLLALLDVRAGRSSLGGT